MEKRIEDLARTWVNTKAEVERLKARLVELEEEMLPSLDTEEGGSRTNKVDGWKIVVKRPINRTIDIDVWEEVEDKIPRDLWPIKTRIEPDPKGCEWLAANHPELWLLASEAITEKVGKPNFVIEEIPE